MDNNNHQQYNNIEEKLLQKENEKKRKKMKVSGKSVFEIQKAIKGKNNNPRDEKEHS